MLAATPATTLATVLRWDVLNGRASLLAKPFDVENFHFYSTVLSGTPEQQPRWQRCANGVSNALPDSVGAIYDAIYFTPRARAPMRCRSST